MNGAVILSHNGLPSRLWPFRKYSVMSVSQCGVNGALDVGTFGFVNWGALAFIGLGRDNATSTLSSLSEDSLPVTPNEAQLMASCPISPNGSPFRRLMLWIRCLPNELSQFSNLLSLP
jgi:hypothetical protein